MTISTAEILPQIPTVDIADAHGADRKSVPAYVANSLTI